MSITLTDQEANEAADALLAGCFLATEVEHSAKNDLTRASAANTGKRLRDAMLLLEGRLAQVKDVYHVDGELPDVEAEQQNLTDSPEWEQQMDEAYAAEAAAKHDLQAAAILSRAYWLNPCQHDSNGGLTWLSKRWYALKLFLCWCLDLKPNVWRHGDCYHRDGVEVCIYRSEGGSYNWSADWMEVGRGVFSGWWWHDEHDGECSW